MRSETLRIYEAFLFNLIYIIMIYELECALENGKVIRFEELDSSNGAVHITMSDYDGNGGFLVLDEKQLYQLIGVLHNIQKQLKTND